MKDEAEQELLREKWIRQRQLLLTDACQNASMVDASVFVLCTGFHQAMFMA
jgi:hypothetical protein